LAYPFIVSTFVIGSYSDRISLQVQHMHSRYAHTNIGRTIQAPLRDWRIAIIEITSELGTLYHQEHGWIAVGMLTAEEQWCAV
jgi:hypothetical protein